MEVIFGFLVSVLGGAMGALAACAGLQLRERQKSMTNASRIAGLKTCQEVPETPLPQAMAEKGTEEQKRQRLLDEQWANLMAYDGTVQDDEKE